ncbi:glycosyltransferase [Neisseria bergeri]|uniref:glycosyltransferase n=1 Tax=Neisseria bergeri TaxID=1906581 RepID=UPI00387E90D6
MKIILTTSMSGLGGTETATFRLGRLLRQHGHDIILASSDGPLLKEAQALGIRWQPVDFYRGGLFGYLKGMIAYARMLRREQPDIIHCQMARIVPACAVAAKIVSPKTKVFYHARGLNPETYPKIARLFDRLGVYIIGNCKHERDKLIRYGFPAHRITYTYNALHRPDSIPEKTAKGCDIAVNAIHSHAMQSVTNKLSDYMALQKPVLNSQTNAEVLDLLNLLPHENYRSGDVDGFVQAAKDILKRKNDPVQSEEIVRRFKRDVAYQKIVNLIERLAHESIFQTPV